MLYFDLALAPVVVSGAAGLPHALRPGPLAQLAEQQTLNLRVEGSIPSRLTTFPNNSQVLALGRGGVTPKSHNGGRHRFSRASARNTYRRWGCVRSGTASSRAGRTRGAR